MDPEEVHSYETLLQLGQALVQDVLGTLVVEEGVLVRGGKPTDFPWIEYPDHIPGSGGDPNKFGALFPQGCGKDSFQIPRLQELRGNLLFHRFPSNGLEDS